MVTREMAWDAGSWLNEPATARTEGDQLLVEAREGSDFWRTTSYGFVHDDGHALLAPLEVGQALEVSFLAELPEQFDQAGVLLRLDESNWLKAGLERADGCLFLGAVATRGCSDWSLAPVPNWTGYEVTVRASRGPDAVTVRARLEDQPWQLVRLAPLEGPGPLGAGPMLCAPTRAGLEVRFTGWRTGPADRALHES